MTTFSSDPIRRTPAETSVLVVGGGVCGLISLTVLKRYGFNVICVEASSKVAGQWNNAYDGVISNNSSAEYCLPGRPFPNGTGEYATKEQILTYWNSLIEEYNLSPHIRLSTSLISMRKTGEEKWICTFQAKNASSYSEIYDKVVIATGYCGQHESRNDKIHLPGRELFPGRIAHISELPSNWMPETGSKVTIIGSGATGASLATKYVEEGYNVKVEHVYRNQKWVIPRYVFGVIPYHELLFSRLSSIMMPSWFQATKVEKVMQSSLMKWFVVLFWRFMEFVFIVSVFAPRKVWPKERLQTSLTTHGTYVSPPGYFRYIRNGQIDTHIGSVDQLTEDGNIVLSNGDKFKSDNIVLATGYIPRIGWFIEDTAAKRALNDPRTLQLYKHVIHPDIPNVGFIGHAQGYMTCTTEFVQACWLSEYFCGFVQVPSREIMMESTRKLYELKTKLSPTEHYKGIVTSGRHHQYLDEMLVSLGVDARRKSNIFSYLLEKTTSADYATVIEEAQTSRLKRAPLTS